MKSLVLGMLLVSASVMAVESPYKQSAKEIEAIVNHKEVTKKLQKLGRISSISYENGVYLVVAGTCALEVTVRRVSLPGPAGAPEMLEVVLGQMTCLP